MSEVVSPPEKGWAEKILDRILGIGEWKEVVSRIQLCKKVTCPDVKEDKDRKI